MRSEKMPDIGQRELVASRIEVPGQSEQSPEELYVKKEEYTEILNGSKNCRGITDRRLYYSVWRECLIRK